MFCGYDIGTRYCIPFQWIGPKEKSGSNGHMLI